MQNSSSRNENDELDMDKYQHFKNQYDNSQTLLKTKRQREEEADAEGQGQPSKRPKVDNHDDEVDKWEAPEG